MPAFADLSDITQDYYATGRVQQQDVLRTAVELARVKDRALRVAADEDASPIEVGPEGLREPHHELWCEGLSDDPPNPGDADLQWLHVSVDPRMVCRARPRVKGGPGAG